MAEETNIDNTTAGETTQQETAETQAATDATTEAAKATETAAAGESVKTTADPEATNNAVMAALRKRDLEAARKLLKDELEPEKPDLSKYVPKEEFDKLAAEQTKLGEQFLEDKQQLQVENIIQRYDLSEADLKMIQTDDLKLFEERAAARAAERDQVSRRSAVRTTEIPDDMKGNKLYDRLMNS